LREIEISGQRKEENKERNKKRTARRKNSMKRLEKGTIIKKRNC